MRTHRIRGLVTAFALCLLVLIPALSMAKPVDYHKAWKVANGWLKANYNLNGNGNQGQGRHQARDIRELQNYDGDVVAYIVDLSPRGFIVVPADDNIEPVLTYGTSGDFDENSYEFSQLADIIVQDVPNRYAQHENLPANERNRISRGWNNLSYAGETGDAATLNSTVVDATGASASWLLTEKWNQGNPSGPYTYNYYTPNHYYTGCVATAMGMILHYFQYPSSASCAGHVYIGGVYTASNFDSTYDYSLMPNSLTSTSSPAEIQEVAKLLADCGTAVQMQYSATGSGAYMSNVVTALKTTFKYSSASWKNGTATDWLPVLQNELDSGYPVNMGITDSAKGAGHSILCDGWGTESGAVRLHLNMGWGGYADNWYPVPGFMAGGYTWDVLQGYVYNIRPGATASLQINNGATYTNNAAVTLTPSMAASTTGAQMRFSNDGTTWSNWQSFATTASWILSDGDGAKTVYYQYEDATGKVSSAVADTIILDSTKPVGSMTINSGATDTYSSTVTLNISAVDTGSGVYQMQFSNDGSTWSTAEPYATTKSWTLSSGSGLKTVYARFTDNAGNISYANTASITVGYTTPPTGTILINNDAAYTDNGNVSLTLSATSGTSGVSQMRFSNDNITWSAWENYADQKSWTLSSGDGLKTVYVQFMDTVGSISASEMDSISMDTTAPTGSISINGGASSTSTLSVVLSLKCADSASGPYQMRFSNDGITWSSWVSYATTASWTLANVSKPRVYAQFSDKLGNLSAKYSDTITKSTTKSTTTKRK